MNKKSEFFFKYLNNIYMLNNENEKKINTIKINRILKLYNYGLNHNFKKLISERSKEKNILISGNENLNHDYNFLKSQLTNKELILNLHEDNYIKKLIH